MTSTILISDLHLTTNPLDEYRWGLFPFLMNKIKDLPGGLKTLVILGDLTQDKDNHPATLVNRVVENLVGLYRGSGLHQIILLRGNHDGLGDVAYFDFLKFLPYIEVITKPVVKNLGIIRTAFLPHTKNPIQDWAMVEFSECKLAFMHQTVYGAVSESGHTLEGDDLLTSKMLRSYKHCKFFSGDVHVPQEISNITYVGAPYPIRFGDEFKGRILILQKGEARTWHYPTIHKAKVTISHAKELAWLPLRKDDQLKVELKLGKEELHEWEARKNAITEWCNEQGIILCGVELYSQPRLKLKGTAPMVETTTPGVAFDKYCKRTKPAESTISTGRKLLKKVEGKPGLRLRNRK